MLLKVTLAKWLYGTVPIPSRVPSTLRFSGGPNMSQPSYMTTTSIEEAQAITAHVENELHDEDDQEEDLKLRRIVRCTNGQLHKQCVD